MKASFMATLKYLKTPFSPVPLALEGLVMTNLFYEKLIPEISDHDHIRISR